MSQHQTTTNRRRNNDLDTSAAGDSARRERAREWSPDRILDPGDSHDKGEPSLCVGEAA
jgi:hypothetical protein